MKKEELEILTSYDNDELISVEFDKNKHSKIAKNTEQKRMIDFRIPEKDLANIKAKATDFGIPYQTLIKIVIHQFSEGKLKIEI